MIIISADRRLARPFPGEGIWESCKCQASINEVLGLSSYQVIIQIRDKAMGCCENEPAGKTLLELPKKLATASARLNILQSEGVSPESL